MTVRRGLGACLELVAAASYAITASCSSATPANDAGPDADVDEDVEQVEDADADAEDSIPDGPPAGGCWTVAPVDGTLAILELDLETGQWRELGRRGEGFTECIEAVTLAIVGRSLGIAMHPWDLSFVDLDEGATRTFSIELYDGISVAGDDLVRLRKAQNVFVDPPPAFVFYTDVEAVLANDVSRVVVADIQGTMLAVSGGLVYVMFDRNPVDPGLLFVHDVASAEVVLSVVLEDLLGRIDGMSVSHGRLVTLSDNELTDSMVMLHDPETGELIDSFEVADTPGTCRPAGLTCAL